MGRSNFSLSLISVLFVLSVLWKPAYSTDACTIGCKGSGGSPSFLTGKKYNYAVEGVVNVYLTGADAQQTGVKLLAQVAVSALGDCRHVLTVQNLAISGPDNKKYGKPAGLEKPVLFSMQDGFVGAELCAEEGDTRRSLNIKRAIVSLLQSGQKSGTEVDIFGACPTEAASSKEGPSVLVHRSRDLARCGRREHGSHDLIAAVYNPHAEIKNTQLLSSSLNVESKVNNGIPEKVSALEEYLYKPFSIGENGARAKVVTKLTLTGQSAGGDNGKFTQSRPIIFENPHGARTEGSNAESALASVKDTAKTLTKEASSKSAGEFAQVIRIFRSTNHEDLMKVYNQVKGNNLEKRVFLDALLRAGTGCSVLVSIQLLKAKELGPIESRLVFMSLGSARHVDDDALKTATTLLDLPNTPKEVYLGVGALAASYCRSHNCHAGKSEGIVALSNKLAGKLNCKPKGKVEEDTVVAVLKGIRNIRHLENNLVDKVAHCAADAGAKARVRVAALEAFHADPCTSKLKQGALKLMKDRSLDSELRIKAYLAVTACPCAKSATEIKTLLETEPVHQVGRFITSSLRHIRASANPDRRLAREHYGNIGTPNKFNIDDRKYSFYREGSYSVDALGVGGTAEQTVIYSQDSFLPRSASLNLTAELFGHNVNILEIGGRQGNLDRVIEHFVGPKGVLRREDPQKIYEELLATFREAEQKVAGKFRGRRNVRADIDTLDKHIKAESTPYDNELDMDFYLKLFGTDAVFLSLGDDKGFDHRALLNLLLGYVDAGMNKAKNFEQELRAHMLFLDAELSYPTAAGLPLRLSLVGSAAARLDLATHLDVRQILRDPKNAKIDVKVIPSSDIEIAGLFYVDADVVSAGIKVVTNLHSSTGGHIVAKVLENGQGFDLNIGLPIDKQEIVTATNDMFYFSAEKGKKEKHTKIETGVTTKDYSGCFDQLSGMLGLTLCGEVSVPFSVSGPEAQASLQKFFGRYPLTGSSRVKLFLEKNNLRGYHIKGVARVDDHKKKTFSLLFEAEGAPNRKTAIAAELLNTDEEKGIKLSLESPIKTLDGQILFVKKPKELAALIKAKMDSDEYFGRIGFTVQGNDNKATYLPIAEYQLPAEKGKQNLKIDGKIIRESNGPVTKYSFEGIKVNIPNSDAVDINGHVSLLPNGFDSDVKAKKGEHNMMISAGVKDHDGKIEFQNTLNPYINFKVNAHSEFEKGNIHNDIDLYYGGDLKSKESRVTLNQMLKYHENSPTDFGLITKNKFHIYALPILAKFDLEVDPKKVDMEVGGQYMDRKADFEVEARTQVKKPGDYIVKVEGAIDNKGIGMFAKRDIVSADKSNLENYITIKNVGKYELSGVVMHKTKPNDINVGAVGHFKITAGNKNEDVRFDVGVIQNPSLYSSHGKVSHGKTDYVDFLLKVTRGASPSGQLKLLLKETIAANGQFKVTDADGKGHGMVIVDFKKAGRKFKGDVKFTAKAPVFAADLDLFLNFEKDNKDKLHLSTNTKNTDKMTESKNVLDFGQKYQLNVHRTGQFERNGKLNLNIDLVLPTERVMGFKLNRDASIKDDTLQGTVEGTVYDSEKRGGATSSITYKAKMANTNLQKETVDYEGQVLLKLKDGRHLTNNIIFKFNPTGKDMLRSDYKLEVTGNLIPQPASLVVYMEATNPDVSRVSGKEKVKVKANYGSDYTMEYNSNDELQFDADKDKKVQSDSNLVVHLPFETAHDIKIDSHISYLLPTSRGKQIEYSVTESVQLNADVYKGELSGKLGAAAGSHRARLSVPHAEPFVIDGSYKANLEGDVKSAHADIKTTYGKGKSANIRAEVGSRGHEYTLNLKAHAPQAEKLKKLEVNVVAKRPTVDSYSNSLEVDADGRVYRSDLTLVYSKAQPLVDLVYTSPSTPKPSRLYIKGTSLSSNQGKVDLKIENIKDLSLDASSEGVIQKDNVALKLFANSEKLGLKSYKVDISSKDAGSGKRLEFHATNDGKNVFSGSTSFISKQEGSKTIIEGSGSVKVKEEQKSANFKYIRTLLTEGPEQGVETFTNVAIGERSYVAESRVTNVEYKTSYVYCEEKKQCASADLNSKIAIDKGVYAHTVNMGLDLRKLGFAPEFGLQMRQEVSETRLPQYTLDVHVSKDEKKYHLHVYNQPEQGKFPSGVTVTLPHRVLALESLLTYPSKDKPFPIKGEVALHLDKNKPNQKLSAKMMVDVTGTEKSHSAVAEFSVAHPRIGKEASFKVVGKLERPESDKIKVESAATISHPSLDKDRQAKFAFEACPKSLKIKIDTPLVQVIDLEGSVEAKDKLQQADVKFSLLQGKAVRVTAVAKDYQYFEFTTGYSDEAQRKLSVVGHVDPDKRVDISADIILPNEKKNIAHGALFIQDNLVKSDCGASQDNFNYFVSALKNDLSVLVKRVRELGARADGDARAVLAREQAALKELKDVYYKEAEALLKEIADDKALKEISQAFHDVSSFLANIIRDILEVTKPIVDTVCEAASKLLSEVSTMWDKKIKPQVEQLYKNLSDVVREYFDAVVDLVAHFVAIVTNFFDKHKAELQELTNTVAEIFKDLTRLVVSQLKEFRNIAVTFFSDLTQQITEMPFIQMLKEKLAEISVPEQVLGALEQAKEHVRLVLPTDEAKAFSDALITYVEKKLRQEKVDDAKELRAVWSRLVAAVGSVVTFVRQQLTQFGVPAAINFNVIPMFSRPSMPAFGGVPSFSLLNQLIHGDIPDVLSIIRAYRVRHLNPLDEVPAKMIGAVVNGQHIFTFDGRHLTFPGSCHYALSHDHVDGNFTLGIRLEAGAPKAIVLADKSGSVVEIKQDGTVTLNGAKHGFPVMEADTFAYRDLTGGVGLGTRYGAMVECTHKLENCIVTVSGFYLGKLRGLLGDGNNEPYDDFRLPSGKIATSEAEFGHAYRLTGACAAAATPEHGHAHHAPAPPACDAVFGGDSPLRPLGLVVDQAPFKQACAHAVASNAAGAQKEACDIGRAYLRVATATSAPALLPAVCVRCLDAGAPRELGDTYEFKVPNKMADIVVVVETTKGNAATFKELVVPLVSRVVDDLKARHLDDVRVHLIGVTSKFPYPIVYDTDNKLKGAKVEFTDASRYNDVRPVVTGNKDVDQIEQTFLNVVNEVKNSLGIYNVMFGYQSLSQLPLRAGAVKHAITVVSEPCRFQALPVQVLRSLFVNAEFDTHAVTNSLITVTEGLKLTGKNAAEVVGFDGSSVLLLGDKKRGKDSGALRAALTHAPNGCISFSNMLNGYVYSASSLHGLPAEQRGAWLAAAASHVAERATAYSQTQRCVCAHAGAGGARSVCVPTERKVNSHKG